MRNWLAVARGFAGALVCVGTGAFAQAAPGTAAAEVRDANRQTLATAELREQPDQVVITLTFQHAGALTGTHAVHIHEHGQCDPPDFLSAGGIFNPLGKQHGLLNPGGPMVGDLPDLVLGPQGLTRYSVTAPLATLRPGPASLVGTALLVDAGQDDNRTQPEGNAGPRIACGVIVGAGQAAPATGPSDATGALVIGVVGVLAIGGGVMLRALSRR